MLLPVSSLMRIHFLRLSGFLEVKQRFIRQLEDELMPVEPFTGYSLHALASIMIQGELLRLQSVILHELSSRRQPLRISLNLVASRYRPLSSGN